MPGPASSTPRRRWTLLPRATSLRVTDDAGQAHEYEMPWNWPWSNRDPDPVVRAIRRRQAVLSFDPSLGWMTVVLLMAISTFARMISLSEYVFIGLCLAFSIVGTWVALWVARGRVEAHWETLGRQWTDAGLSHGRCPVCAYSLQGAVTDGGHARCAECGARWQTDRIRPSRPAPPRRGWRSALAVLAGSDVPKSVQDDAGQVHAAERLRAIGKRLSGRGPVAAEAARAVWRDGAPVRVLLAILILVGAAITLGMTILVARTGFVGLSVFLCFSLAGICACAYFVMISDLGVSARARRRGMLDAGLCPVCAADLSEAEPDHAGVVACRACSARWRIRPPDLYAGRKPAEA